MKDVNKQEHVYGLFSVTWLSAKLYMAINMSIGAPFDLHFLNILLSTYTGGRFYNTKVKSHGQCVYGYGIGKI